MFYWNLLQIPSGFYSISIGFAACDSSLSSAETVSDSSCRTCPIFFSIVSGYSSESSEDDWEETVEALNSFLASLFVGENSSEHIVIVLLLLRFPVLLGLLALF